MVCHVIIPPVNAQSFLFIFYKSSTFPERGQSAIILMWGKITQRSCFTEQNFFFFLSPHLFLCFWCCSSDLPCLTISSFFSPHEIFCPTRASGLNKSNLSCRKRKYRKPLVYFMVISCDRGGGGEQQRVTRVEEEEVMVFRHLYSLPRTVTTSNGTDRGTKGRDRGGVQRLES